MSVYYNEFDKNAAAWLRELIKKGLIADGEVDERSICDVREDDLRGFTQCHFFAGIGVWSHALRGAGVPDDYPLWTGSCPCQPFSVAGKGAGTDDERHLWPVFRDLIDQCRPPVVFGEQVASAAGRSWLSSVRLDLEALGYGVGAADLCAAGVGAPHIRQRLYFVGVANPVCSGSGERGEPGYLHQRLFRERTDLCVQVTERSSSRRMADTLSAGRPEGRAEPRVGSAAGGGCGSRLDHHHHHQGLEGLGSGHRAEGGRDAAAGSVATAGEPCRLADDNGAGCQREQASRVHGRRDGEVSEEPAQGGSDRPLGDDASGRRQHGGLADAADERNRTNAGSMGEGIHQAQGQRFEPTAIHGSPMPHTTAHAPDLIWRTPDWLFCRDGKWRPVEPGTFPLAHGAPARVGRLRGYGNAIVAPLAQAFIEASLAAFDDVDILS